MTVHQMREEQLRGELCIVFRSIIGGIDGQSKTELSGWNATAQKTIVLPIPNEIVLGGRLLSKCSFWYFLLRTE